MPEKPPLDPAPSHITAYSEPYEGFWADWNAHVGFLEQLCMRYMGNFDDAHEALSGSMLRAFESAGKLTQHVGNRRAWLATITYRHCLDLLSARHRSHVNVGDLDSLASLADQAFNNEADLETLMIREEHYQAVRLKMQALPDRLRCALELRAFQGLPYEEIGRLLQVNADTARKRVQQARIILREAIPFGPPQSQRPTHRLPDDGGPRPLDTRPLEQAAAPTPHITAQLTAPFAGRQWVVFRHGRIERIQQRLHTLDRYVVQHPTGWVKRAERAGLLVLLGRIVEAGDTLADILEGQPNRHDLRLLLISLKALTGDSDAIRNAELGTVLASTTPQRSLFQALAYQLKGNLSKAEAILRPAIVLHPDSPELTFCHLRVLLAMQRHKEAKDAVEAWLRLHPMNRVAHYIRHCLPCTELEDANWRAETRRRFPMEPLALAQSASGKNPMEWESCLPPVIILCR